VGIRYAATHCVGFEILRELEYQTTASESKFPLQWQAKVIALVLCTEKEEQRNVPEHSAC